MPQSVDEEEVNELFGVDVDTVGLVRKGANRRPFFLVKSEEEDHMANEEALQILDELEKEEEVTRTSWDKMLTFLKSAFTPKGTEEPAKEEPAEEEPVKNVEKSELEQRLEALEKAHQKALQEAEDKAEAVKQEAKGQLEKAEQRVEALEKRNRMMELEPIAKSAGMEAEVLYRLEKQADEDVFKAVMERFNALNEQLKAGGLFKEIGSSEPAEIEPHKKIMAQAKEIAKAENISFEQAIVTAVKSQSGGYEEYREQVMGGK